MSNTEGGGLPCKWLTLKPGDEAAEIKSVLATKLLRNAHPVRPAQTVCR